MRKVYIFERLTGQVKRFAAFMLITLLAVGNAFADYDGTGLFTKINSLDELTTGYYVVTNQDGEYAMSNQLPTTGSKFFYSEDAVFYNPAASLVWLVTVSADGITLYNEAIGAYAAYSGSGNTAYTITELTDKGRWTPSLDANGNWILENVATSGRFLSYNSSSPRFACYGNHNQDELSFYKWGEAPALAAPTFSIPTGTYYTEQTVSLTAAPGANIFYSINDGEPILYNAPFTVSTTSTISAYAVMEEDTSATATITIILPVQLANIAALISAEADNSTIYQVTGDVQYVWRHGRSMYLQDATGGLLVYDNTNPVITTEYNNGDVISGGIYGKLTPYNGMVEFVPTKNTAEGTPGIAIQPIETTIAAITANPDQYMYKLVVLRNGSFQGKTITTGNSAARTIEFYQGGDTIKVYNQFNTVNATFTANEPGVVIGFVGYFENNNGSYVEIFPRDNADLIGTAAPYACDFENGNYEWNIVNGNNTNKWYIGEAQGFDNNKLYISSSNGITNKYNVSEASVSHAYVYTMLPASDVLLTFDVRTVGDENDFLQVSVLDEAPVAGTLPTNYLTRIYGVNEFTTQTLLIPASNAGAKYLVFTWNNNANGGTQTPAAIDNVAMNTTCTTPTNLVATVNDQTAVITWNAPEGQDAWTLQYKDAAADAWQTVQATTASVTLNNLSTQTFYDVRVKADCGNNSSAWLAGQFEVPCVNGTSAPADVTIGNGTNTSYYAPFGPYYANAWVQTIYPASYFTSPGYINSLSWEVNSANTQNCTSLKIYVGTTTHENNLSTTDWVPMEDLTLVYEAENTTIGSASGWETYTFNTPYYYNGEENLVVVASRTAPSYKSLYYKATGNNTNAVMYRWNDYDASYASHPGTNTATGRNANLPNMIVTYADDCHDLHCATPTELTVSDITTNGAVLNWEAGDATAWQVNYMSAYDEEWTTVEVTENTYTLTGLDQNTTYYVRVKANCGTVGMSGEAALGFTTVANCVAPQELTVTANTHTLNVNWTPVEGVNEYVVEVKGLDDDALFVLNVLNASQTNLTGLTEGNMYLISVKSVCGEQEVSDWTSVNFTMPTICSAPAGMQVVEKDANSATITWTDNGAEFWTVEYGEMGFALGTGTQIVVNENTVTLTGLNGYSNYDVYAKADCGLGYVSNWSSKFSFKTDCGPITVTQENPWVEDFESYTGSGNLAFDDCWATPEMTSYNSPFIYRNYAAAAHSGKNSAELKGNSGAVATLVLPEFTNNLMDLQFSYYGRVTGSTPGTMQLGYVTDAADASTFVEVQQVPAQSGSYNRANAMLYGPFTFGENVPDGARITLRFTSATGSCSWNLDDFTVEMKPDCQIPTMLTVTDVAATSVTLAWTANGSEEAWNIEYGPAGFEQGNGTVVAADANPFTVTGLSDATTYDFYVQANCVTTVSEYSLPTTVTTKCLPLATPYTENFDSYTGSTYSTAGVVPICWDTYTNNTDKKYAPHVNTGANTAFNYAESGKGLGFYASSAGNSAFAILPMFEHPVSTMTLSFWRRMESTSYGVLTVGYVTDANDPINSYTEVATIPSVTTSNNDYTVDFTAYNGSIPAGARIAFRWYKESTWYTCAIDNVSITSTADASCQPVTNLTADNITYNSAVLTWTPGADETAWTVAYKATADEEWTTAEVATSSLTLTGLSSVTEYQVSVTSICGDAVSEAATTTFTTICGNPCEYTFVLHDSYGDGWNGNSISISYSGGGTQYVTLSSGSEGTVYVTIPEGETMTCNWSNGNYSYETSFEIKNDCGETVYSGSDAQSSEFFTATCPDMSSCPKPTNMTVPELSSTSAVISWTPAGEETAWIVTYTELPTEDLQTTTVTTTSFALTGLTPNTQYLVSVKADCGDEQSNASFVFFTTCYDGCSYTISMHDSYGDGWNGGYILASFSDGTSQEIEMEAGTYSNKIYDDAATITIPAGESMTLSWYSGSYDSEVSFEILDPCGVVIQAYSGSSLSSGEEFFTQACAALTCPAPLALSATEVENGSSVITWFAGGEETTWSITLTPEEGDAITATVNEPTYTITGMQPGDSYVVTVKAICGEEDESVEVTTTVICPALVDIALVNVYTNPSNCDLSTGMIARITVKNMMESPITSFEAYYQVNGEGPVVHETVWPYLSFDYGETYSYTFLTAPVFTETTNFITAWVVVPGETNTDDNTASSGVTLLTEEQALPYVETFPASSADNWAVVDNNGDNSTFTVTGGTLKYSGSDEFTANDYAVSPCLEYVPYTNYLISFDYKANSPYYTEKLTAYYGPSVNLYYDYPFGTITFNNAEYAHYSYVGYMAMTMDNLHVAFKAESPVGTDGFSIDNVTVKKAVSFSVNAGEHGSVAVENAVPQYSFYYAGENDEVTLVMTPEFGYHVAGIYVNGELARGENPNNAPVDFFTFTPSTGDYVTVLFTGNVYNVTATVNNLYATDYNDDAPGAVYTPAHELVAQGGSHTGVLTLAPNYHFISMTVNGVNVAPVPSNVDGQYLLTLNPVMEDKDINVVVELDSAHVIYNVLAGQGTINGHFVVDGTATTYPVVFTETVVGYSNLWSTITPAPGYHVASIVVDGVEHNIISEYYFAHIMGTHTVDVVFEKNHYYITTNAYGNGTVSAGEDFDYDPDHTYTFTATPDAGYRIASITRNNVAVAVADPVAGYTETLTNILSDYNYEVWFEQNTYSITATCGAHGTISPNGVSNYLYHQDAQVVITADLGYYIASVTYDGFNYELPVNDQLTSLTVPFLNIAENHTISATFAPIMYTVTVNAGAHGDITPGTGSFAFGTTPTFNITPATGYGIVDVTVDGESVGAVNAYTFPALTANHTIAATFAAYQYTINATAGNGGTITPAGNTTLAYNGTQVYTISANAGYHVSDVFVDGVSVGAVTTYTFSNVTENHIIYAAFEANEYTVTVNQPANGMINPGTTTVLYGATPAFVITPNVGYNVTAITVNGSNVSLANVPNVNGTYTYTFPAISANQTITATMTAKTYTITATAGANGSINPGTQTVNFGASKTFTFTPNAGYVVDNVTVDGANLGALSSYTFTNVTANHTINVTFAQEECEVPYSLYATHIGENTAMLHWSHPTATSFDIQYKTLTSNLTSVTNVSGNSYELAGLDANTTYLWQVRANCTNSNHSDWSNLVSFTTEETPIEIGIEDFVKNSVKVYAEHQNVHILNNEGLTIDNVRIFDTYGRLIYSGSVSSDHEVIGLNVATGTYIVNVTTDQGVANYKVTIMR